MFLLHQVCRLCTQRHIGAAAGAGRSPEELLGDPAHQRCNDPDAIVPVGIPRLRRRTFERSQAIDEALLARSTDRLRCHQASEGGKLAEHRSQQQRQQQWFSEGRQCGIRPNLVSVRLIVRLVRALEDRFLAL